MPFLLVYSNVFCIMTPAVDLFVYGTLMDERLVLALVGRTFPRRQAELVGFQRLTPRRGYPYIIPNPTARTAGLALCEVDDEALAVLDRYKEEGWLYQRRRVIALVEGHPHLCETYVGKVNALEAYALTRL